MKVNHELDAFYLSDSRILILGSIPSPKSRQEGFYYAHPQNRFWKVLSHIYHSKEPKTIDEKKSFLKQNKIALFDVLYSCEIKGASDSSIKKPVVNDLTDLLKNSHIEKIYTTGKTAYQLYNRYLLPKTKKEATYLPSTSCANCQMSLEDLIKEYQKIVKELKN